MKTCVTQTSTLTSHKDTHHVYGFPRTSVLKDPFNICCCYFKFLYKESRVGVSEVTITTIVSPNLKIEGSTRSTHLS